jgi:hypothetical protein
MTLKVERYDESRGECALFDPETGKRWRSPCELTGRTRQHGDQKTKETGGYMETQTYENAGEEMHAKIEAHMDKTGVSYAEAMRVIASQNRELARRYSMGESQPVRQFHKASEERERRIVVYQDHFNVNERRATEMVEEHDPKMRNIPLDAGSVVDARVQERMQKQGAKSYSEEMQAVLVDDPLLSECYRAGKPYIEAARKYAEDPMASPEIRAITEPRPDAVVTPSPDRPAPEFANTARLRLGALLAGAKSADGSVDISLALQIAGLVPDEVRSACGEALDELARAMIQRRGLRGQASEAYPEGYRLAVAEHPALWSASQTGRLTEESLKDLFIQWFK